MFRIALVLFRHVLGRPEQLSECPSMYETMDKLRKIPAAYMQEEFLVQEVCSVGAKPYPHKGRCDIYSKRVKVQHI